MGPHDPQVVGHAQGTASRMSLEGWPLRWKVAATLVVPIALAATFGAIRIQSELSAASKLNVASGNVGIVAPAVEFVDRLDDLADAGAANSPLQEPSAQFDASATALAALIDRTELDPAVAAKLSTASSTAASLRDEIQAGPVPQLRIAEQADAVADDVASAIESVTATIDDSDVRPLADRLVAVLAAQRALTTQQILVDAPDFATSVALRTKAADAAGAEAAAIDRLAQLTPGDDDAALRGPSDLRRDAYSRPPEQPVDPTEFTTSLQQSTEQYDALAQQVSSDLESTVYARATTLRSAALRDTAIILGAVLAALVFALGIGRSLIRSVSRLRRGAVRVAQVQLPDEIDRLSKGGGMPEITALPVRTNEEMGQLARAIDDIHLQAVRLASEHGVHLQIGDMFETLSRRSRSLVEEQLELIETLEHDEDDPARLHHLFRLDHLATRMRRNGDNLLVLADTVERHRRADPVSLSDVLRAAMSEVEDYRRVQIGPGVDGAVVGTASNDIGHLIAELLDNALRYSPPESPVLVTVSRAVDGGILVEVADRGLGVPDEDLRAANERLALGGEVTSDTAKRMGLFVVGRLARRHDATVRLRTTAPMTDRPGVTASVHLPGALLAATTDIVDHYEDRRAGLFAQAPQRSSLQAVRSPVAADNRAVLTPVPPVELPVRNGGLPTRLPGASGVIPPAQVDPAEPEPAVVPAPPIEPPWPTADSDGALIYERMTTEWTIDNDAGWAAAAAASEEKPMRHTESGLPIRERGAHLVPDRVNSTSSRPQPERRSDPAAIRDVLSRQLSGVRRGRAESDTETEHTEGDR